MPDTPAPRCPDRRIAKCRPDPGPGLSEKERTRPPLPSLPSRVLSPTRIPALWGVWGDEIELVREPESLPTPIPAPIERYARRLRGFGGTVQGTAPACMCG